MAEPAIESCPYLDTVTRSLLDFDFEHSCSVSLDGGPHIYGCLVCGKFFRGRGKGTPAYTHSVNDSHFVFVHLSRGTFHCLPDDYEIKDPSLNDISLALRPTFTEEDISNMDQQTSLARDLFGRRYLPGFVGLNNLNKTDYINSTLQALARVKPLRDFFLRCGTGQPFEIQLSSTRCVMKGKKRLREANDNMALQEKRTFLSIDPQTFSPIAYHFGEMIRKIWSDKRFKATVNPHMLVQAISVASKKRFTIGIQAEAGEFLAWLLHQLHVGIGGSKKPGSSIIHEIFQGLVEITDRRPNKQKTSLHEEGDNKILNEMDDRLGSDDEMNIPSEKVVSGLEYDGKLDTEVTTETTFLQLTVEIPEKPLFKDNNGGIVIPQEPLVNVLKKFDGNSFHDAYTHGSISHKRRYRIKKLPNYLILHLVRFKKNHFIHEKNPTIVVFPVRNLDFGSYVFSSEMIPSDITNKYDLVANITHNIPAEVGREGQFDPLKEGQYKCHAQHRATGQWYDVQDLHVQEIMPQLIGLSESCILILERKLSR